MEVVRTFRMRALSLGVFGLLFSGCGGGGDNGDTGTGPDREALREDALAVMGVLQRSSEGLDLVQLFAGEQVIEGESGRLVITIGAWTFDQYSPDGQVVIDGEAILNVLAQPIIMTGELQVSGSQQATVELDLTIDITDPENIVLGGTITYNGVEFEASELREAAAAADSTAAESSG